MATREQIAGHNGVIDPVVMWGYGVSFDIRRPAAMPPDFPRRPDDIEQLEADIWEIFSKRQEITPADAVKCKCGRDVPDFPDLTCCPFCGIKYVYEPAKDEADDDEAEPEPETTFAPTELVPMSAQELAQTTMATDKGRRLEEVESEIGRWTTTTVRAYWETGRLLEAVRAEKLYEVAGTGCKTFKSYLDSRSVGVTRAYELMGFHASCPEDMLSKCEIMSAAVLFEFARQSQDAVDSVADGAKYLHGVYRNMIAVAAEESEPVKRPAVKQIVAKAAATPGSSVAQAVARQSPDELPESSPAAKRGRNTAGGRPRKVVDAIPESTPVDSPKVAKPGAAEPHVPKLVRLGLENINDAGVGAYINPKSNKPIARPAGNIVNRCLHIRGADGKFMRILLGKNSWSWTIEDEPGS